MAMEETMGIVYLQEILNTKWKKLCLNMAEKGLLAKPTHGNIIRFAPPLIINRKELDDCIDIIISSLKEFEV